MSNVQSKLLQVANRDVANIVKHWNLGQRGLQCVASGESGQFEGCVSGEEVLLSSKIINDPLHG
ncbi:MAG: hypothetical protein NTZ16_16410, partial [Verrucomicrobia bacterium]|nr:hypothetical protein [Verrucomicrobiota bacterium]